MFQFEWHPHIGEIQTEIWVYEKGGVIKHVEVPAIKLSFLICEKIDLVTMWNSVLVYYRVRNQFYDCLAVGHKVWNITMKLHFSIIQNMLFPIVTHLGFCLTMAASAAAVAGGNQR